MNASARTPATTTPAVPDRAPPSDQPRKREGLRWISRIEQDERAARRALIAATPIETYVATLLDVLELVVPRPWKTIEPSEAVFYRRISKTTPTLLLDEVDLQDYASSTRAAAATRLRAVFG